jgi:hypothetical protein
MATLFQIRRGSGSVSLVDGEIFLHKGSGSLQVGMGTSNTITLAKLNDINSGSIHLSGDITASNAYFSGDVAISGNLFLGNNTGDNISVPGVFTTNLVPGANGTLDLGTNGAKWRTLWVNSVSASFTGSINGLDVIPFSTSVDSRLDNLQDFTASVTGGVDKVAYFNQGNRITSYPNSYLGSQTFGLGTSATNSVEPERLMVDNGNSFNIATFQTSKNDSFAEVNIKNFGSGSNSSTDLVLWNDVTTEESGFVDLGINSSNYSANELGYAGDGYLVSSDTDLYVGGMNTGSHGHVHIFGGRMWNTSSISVYSDGTIGINTDKFDNNTSTIPTTGYVMEISGNVLFDNNIGVIGNISSSTISGMGGVSQFVVAMQNATASLNTHSASVDGKFASLATISGSLIQTASANTISITNLNLYTSSLKTAIELTGSTVSFLGDIVVYGTQSILHSTNLAIDDNLIYLNVSESLANPDLGILGGYNDGTYAHTGIFRDASDSGIWKVFKGLAPETSGTIDTSHPSFKYADFAANNISASSLTGIGNISVYSTSVDSRLNNLQSKSASVDVSISSLGQYTQSQDTKNSTLQSYTASVNSDLTNIHQTTASLNLFSASVTSSLVSIYQTTASLNSFSESVLSSLTSIYQTTASLNVASASLQSFSSSTLLRLTELENETGSLEGRASSLANITGSLIQTASLNTIAISNLNTETASLEARFATLEQVTSSLKIHTASVNTYTSSTDTRLDLLEYTASISVGAGLVASFDKINAWTASTDTRIDALELYSASYAQYFTYSGSQFHIDFNV